MALTNIIPEGLVPKPDHADVLLELAYLTTAVDGRLLDEEIEAYRVVIARLRGTPSVSDSDLDALFDRYGGNIEFAEISERVQKIAPTLPAELRPLAFQLSIGLGVADLDTNEDESDLQALLGEALGFDQVKIDQLTAEVYAALDAGEDEGE
jgi:hypothetical protein